MMNSAMTFSLGKSRVFFLLQDNDSIPQKGVITYSGSPHGLSSLNATFSLPKEFLRVLIDIKSSISAGSASIQLL